MEKSLEYKVVLTSWRTKTVPRPTSKSVCSTAMWWICCDDLPCFSISINIAVASASPSTISTGPCITTCRKTGLNSTGFHLHKMTPRSCHDTPLLDFLSPTPTIGHFLLTFVYLPQNNKKYINLYSPKLIGSTNMWETRVHRHKQCLNYTEMICLIKVLSQ